MKFSDDPQSPLHKHNVVVLVTVGLILLGFFIYDLSIDKDRKAILESGDNKVVVIGSVKQLDSKYGRGDAQYTYEYDGESYEEFFGRYMPCQSRRYDDEARDVLMQVPIHVAVDVSDPSMSYPLIEREHYELAGMKYPDEIAYIYREYIACEGEG